MLVVDSLTQRENHGSTSWRVHGNGREAGGH